MLETLDYLNLIQEQLKTQVIRDCNHSTNKDEKAGSLTAKRVSSNMTNCYSESTDILFGTADSTVGASKINTTTLKLSLLPSDFAFNGWGNIDGNPSLEVSVMN